jgi:aspartate/methionine/tyrosine aminotransferase
MPLEEWFNEFQFQAYNLGESSVSVFSLDEVKQICDIDFTPICSLPLRYGHHSGAHSLRETIARDYPGLGPENILVTNGASEALFLIYLALLEAGDHVVIQHPNYPSHWSIPRALGCRITFLQADFNNNYEIDLEKASFLISKGIKILSICNPNNPTGQVFTSEQLKTLIEMAERHNFILLVDEVYRDLSFDVVLPTAACLSSKVISVGSLSKAYGLPGLRIGWIVTQNQELLKSALAIKEHITICNSSLTESLATKILEKKDLLITEVKRRVVRNYSLLQSWLASHSDILEYVEPKAGVVCLPRFKISVTIEFYRTLARKYGVFVIPGSGFEMSDEYFRVGFGGKKEELEKGLELFDTAIKEEVLHAKRRR